jgi:hypothetical protein
VVGSCSGDGGTHVLRPTVPLLQVSEGVVEAGSKTRYWNRVLRSRPIGWGTIGHRGMLATYWSECANARRPPRNSRGGTASPIPDPRGLFCRGTSFRIHQLPTISLFATSSGWVPGTLTTHNKSLIAIKLEGFFCFGGKAGNPSSVEPGYHRLTIDDDTCNALPGHLIQKYYNTWIVRRGWGHFFVLWSLNDSSHPTVPPRSLHMGGWKFCPLYGAAPPAKHIESA